MAEHNVNKSAGKQVNFDVYLFSSSLVCFNLKKKNIFENNNLKQLHIKSSKTEKKLHRRYTSTLILGNQYPIV